ncbi:hypothetical protein [Lentzea sp. NBRC 102530]|uniref:hypothetical protein n=1 Tax=Lentzea sp. NBRC 102530 TaxID=3032201 RepID=UPI0024A2D024|nr:hypothetical protein [Lentzea sp. NBRC 102530]GLY54889.1 hypothetical protein Lesp01_85440 [Lentzea sp. NBRC 102530]
MTNPAPTCSTTPTHRVILTHPAGHTSTNDVTGVDALAALALIYPDAQGEVLILDREHHGLATINRLGWRTQLLTKDNCPHVVLKSFSEPGSMVYGTRCPACTGEWHWDDTDLPEEIEQRAMPEWQAAGL